MVDLFPAVGITADNVFIYDLAANQRGTSVLTAGTAVLFPLADVTDTNYVTVFQATLGLEDVGILQVLSLFVDLFWQVKGDGNTRWQLSGDGGLSFISIETSAIFHFPGFIDVERGGAGTWLSDFVQSGVDILTGDNKFVIRLQARVDVGGNTVSSKLDDRSFLSLQYRRKITTET